MSYDKLKCFFIGKSVLTHCNLSQHILTHCSQQRNLPASTTQFLVRVVLMWRRHEKWRMGHTMRISHSPF